MAVDIPRAQRQCVLFVDGHPCPFDETYSVRFQRDPDGVVRPYLFKDGERCEPGQGVSMAVTIIIEE